MSDLYTELLVKKKRTAKDILVKYGMIGLTAAFVVAGIFVNPLLIICAVGAGIGCYFVVPRTDLEYEYLFVNGDMDIDVIMSRSKRKKVKSLKLSEADLAAPLKSHRMDYYNNMQKIKVLDYSSGDPAHERFAIITKDGNSTCKVIIEPDEHLIKAMKNSAPSKVFLD